MDNLTDQNEIIPGADVIYVKITGKKTDALYAFAAGNFFCNADCFGKVKNCTFDSLFCKSNSVCSWSASHVEHGLYTFESHCLDQTFRPEKSQIMHPHDK